MVICAYPKPDNAHVGVSQTIEALLAIQPPHSAKSTHVHTLFNVMWSHVVARQDVATRKAIFRPAIFSPRDYWLGLRQSPRTAGFAYEGDLSEYTSARTRSAPGEASFLCTLDRACKCCLVFPVAPSHETRLYEVTPQGSIGSWKIKKKSGEEAEDLESCMQQAPPEAVMNSS